MQTISIHVFTRFTNATVFEFPTYPYFVYRFILVSIRFDPFAFHMDSPHIPSLHHSASRPPSRPLQLGVAPLQRRRQLRLCRRRRRGRRVGRAGRRQVWSRRRRALVGRTQGMIPISAGALCFEQVSVWVHCLPALSDASVDLIRIFVHSLPIQPKRIYNSTRHNLNPRPLTRCHLTIHRLI